MHYVMVKTSLPVLFLMASILASRFTSPEDKSAHDIVVGGTINMLVPKTLNIL